MHALVMRVPELRNIELEASANGDLTLLAEVAVHESKEKIAEKIRALFHKIMPVGVGVEIKLSHRIDPIKVQIPIPPPAQTALPRRKTEMDWWGPPELIQAPVVSAQPRELFDQCPACSGNGTIWYYEAFQTPQHQTAPCPRCKGEGQIARDNRPRCGWCGSAELDAEFVDVGVGARGVQVTPYNCGYCGAQELGAHSPHASQVLPEEARRGWLLPRLEHIGGAAAVCILREFVGEALATHVGTKASPRNVMGTVASAGVRLQELGMTMTFESDRDANEIVFRMADMYKLCVRFSPASGLIHFL